MRKSRFSRAQIVATLREFDAGAPAEELARRHGIHANTIRLWRSKYLSFIVLSLSMNGSEGPMNVSVTPSSIRHTIPARGYTIGTRSVRAVAMASRYA